MEHYKNYIKSALFEFRRYKTLGDKTFPQLSDEDLLWRYGSEDNSIAQIVKHISGNMLSRWTNFLTEDGEKEWRHRDTEFEATYKTKAEMIAAWEKGWNCLFDAINPLQPEDVSRIIYIRNQGHTVLEAITRQLCHYPYHIGQIIYVAKLIRGNEWISLSIPKGKSSTYNADKFSTEKSKKPFTLY